MYILPIKDEKVEEKKIDDGIKYIVGRSNLALTIFVPYNCPNKCPFCNSKKEYENNKDFSLESILKSIAKVIKYPFIKDVVITGGEPFSDLEQFQQLLNYLRPLITKYHKKLYINTTLPCGSDLKYLNLIEFIYKNQKIIDGLNISRHIDFKTKYENNNLIKDIYDTTKIKIRINSVLYGDINKYNEENVVEFMDKYLPICDNINFRADYTQIKNQNDLRNINKDKFVDMLFNLPKLNYISSGGCMVCNNDDFVTNNEKYVNYHRGMEDSLIIKGKYYIINDIVIKQNGKIVLDWKNKEINLNKMDEILN